MVNRREMAAAGCAMLLGLAGQAEAASRPSIAVVAYNQAAVIDDTLTRAKAEISRIYGEAGVDVIWIDHAAGEQAGTFTIRLLIRRAVTVPGSVMGSVAGDTHETGGLASVFYERALQSAHQRRQDVAGVLAYAVAHEMGHLLLPYPAHAPSGIMRAAWDGDDLRHMADGSLQFTPAQQTAIHLKASTCCLTATQVHAAALPKP